MQPMNPITKRIACFVERKFGFYIYADDGYERMREYVRVSEYVDVTFPPRDDSESKAAFMAALDNEEQTARADFDAKLASINKRRNGT